MANPSTPKIVLGVSTVGDKSDPLAKYHNPADAQAFINLYRKAGYVELDTARAYPPHAAGTSELLLGQTDFKEWALMDTKILPRPGSGTREKVAESVRLSLEGLRVDKVRIRSDDPSAAGIFSGKINPDTATPGSRWDPSIRGGQLYRDWFFKADIFSAATAVHAAAQKEGLTGHAVALRWILHHSILDSKLGEAIIIGASSLGQLEENLEICKAGPLPAHFVQMMNEMGDRIRESAPPYSL